MTEKTVIRVENVTVRFNIASEKIDSIKEYFVKLMKRQLQFQEFLALKNVGLDIKRGESWGIVGRNGAGKSTLLKLICGILLPDKGSVVVDGAISPLLELGAGFDPDLTAEENIFLEGAILGRSRKFMEEHYDEIVEFSELKDFMKMPIKNYSSGMQARMGFAVATVVDPEILIVDEILGVGDMAFQVKCEKRIRQMLDHAATLLLVSHSNEQVQQLCNNAIWVRQGEIVMSGEAGEVCNAYADYYK
ncbi:MAG: ABC transporter ATP-binding protein [Treponema sp.]|jgi:lipopolysaccharide transport system ATP-binding protein|nr:ABC transporter ATP-binding protein [Treponema sp.]